MEGFAEFQKIRKLTTAISNVDATLDIYEEMPHVLQKDSIADSKIALRKVNDFLKEHCIKPIAKQGRRQEVCEFNYRCRGGQVTTLKSATAFILEH